jgi:tetratricopeptide (TPR) repeat protein
MEIMELEAGLSIIEGNFSEALVTLNEALKLDTSKENLSISMGIHDMKAHIYMALDQPDSAVREIDHAGIRKQLTEEEEVNIKNVINDVYILAWSGDYRQAQEVAECVREYWAERFDRRQEFDYAWAEGMIALARGDYGNAIDRLEKADEYPRPLFYDDSEGFSLYYSLGKAYLMAGDHEKSIAEFERQLSIYGMGRMIYAVWGVDMHYYLGMAYEKSGEMDDAMAQYEMFLDLWKNADEGIPILVKAREHYSKLMGSL